VFSMLIISLIMEENSYLYGMEINLGFLCMEMLDY